jgi:hypothetical protein
MVDDVVDQMFAPQEATYTLSGNTLTLNWEVDMEVSGMPAGIGNMSWHSSGTDVYTRNGTGGGGTGGGTGGGGGTGSGSGNNYPPSNILAEYGLSGLTPITGATNVAYAVTKYGGITDTLSIIFDGSSTTDNYVSNWFTSNGWTSSLSSTSSDSVLYYYSKTGFTAMYSRDPSDNDCTIVSYKGGLGF